MDEGYRDPVADEAIELVHEWTYRDDLRVFLGKNSGPFLDLYDRRQAGAKWPGFCWPALLVPFAWFMYRRMYSTAAGVFLALYLVLPAAPEGSGTLGLGIPVAVAVLAKPLYFAVARLKIKKAGMRSMNEADRQRRIIRSGGVSAPGAFIGATISALPLFGLLL